MNHSLGAASLTTGIWMPADFAVPSCELLAPACLLPVKPVSYVLLNHLSLQVFSSSISWFLSVFARTWSFFVFNQNTRFLFLQNRVPVISLQKMSEPRKHKVLMSFIPVKASHRSQMYVLQLGNGLLSLIVEAITASFIMVSPPAIGLLYQGNNSTGNKIRSYLEQTNERTHTHTHMRPQCV